MTVDVNDVIRARLKMERLFKGDFNDPLYRAAHAEWVALSKPFAVERGYLPDDDGVNACAVDAKPRGLVRGSP